MSGSSTGKGRAVVIVGAGASVEYGIPITARFGALIDQAVQADPYCVRVGGADAYSVVRQRLTDYYSSAEEAHFEGLSGIPCSRRELNIRRQAERIGLRKE